MDVYQQRVFYVQIVNNYDMNIENTSSLEIFPLRSAFVAAGIAAASIRLFREAIFCNDSILDDTYSLNTTSKK
jgi:hypothetical protein